MSGNFLNYIKMSRTLSRLKGDGRISLEMPQRKRASSHIEGRISWFFSSCGRKRGVPLELRRDLRDLLVLPQESLVCMRVTRGHSGFLSCQCQVLSPHMKLRPEPRVSSPVLTWILGFLSSFNMESGLVSCGDMQVCFPLEL